MEELTFQQRLWKGAGVVVYAVRPLILFLCLPALLMSFGMMLMGGREAGELIRQSGNFYYTLGILLSLVILHKRSRKRNSSIWEDAVLERQGLVWKRIALLAGAGIGLAVFFSALITLLPLPKGWIASYQDSSGSFQKGTDQLLSIASTVIFAPVAEEVVFRGYMLGRLLKGFSEKWAIGLSALLFALCHVSPLWVIYAGLMGLMLGWVAVREDNTIYAIALHISFNLSVIPISWVNREEGRRALLFGSPFKVGLWGVLAACLAGWACYRYVREKSLCD